MSEKKDLWDRLVETWWTCVLLGVVLLGLTFKEYRELRMLETGEKDILYVGRQTRVLYKLGGKWLVAGIGGVISLGLIGYGAYLAVQRKPDAGTPSGRTV